VSLDGLAGRHLSDPPVLDADRPRERLESLGSEALSDAELLGETRPKLEIVVPPEEKRTRTGGLAAPAM